MILSEPIRVDSCAWYPDVVALRDKLQRESRFGDSYSMGTFANGLIGVPREMCHHAWRGTALDQRVVGPIIPSRQCLYPVRNDEQAEVIGKSVCLLRQDMSHIVEASTGFGKTFCALNIVYSLRVKTLIVVTKEDLLQSWMTEASKFFNIEADKIGIIQQGRCDVVGKEIVIGMVHSLAQRDDYPKSILQEFGLVVFDEVHHMAAETFSTVAAMFPAKLRLGFSATPYRQDGKDPVFQGHIGKIMVRAKLIPMPPKVLVKRTGWKLPRVARRINGQVTRIQMPHEAGKLTHIITAMARDQSRNNMVVGYATQAYRRGRWTVVLSELAEDKHLGMLREMCKNAGIPDTEMAYYKGGMTTKEREVAKTKRLVFATYGMTGEATDVPWWDCAILATPRANVVQAAGRVLREYPNKPTPVIIDLVDDDSPILEGYFKARLKQYTSQEMQGQVIYL